MYPFMGLSRSHPRQEEVTLTITFHRICCQYSIIGSIELFVVNKETAMSFVAELNLGNPALTGQSGLKQKQTSTFNLRSWLLTIV